MVATAVLVRSTVVFRPPPVVYAQLLLIEAHAFGELGRNARREARPERRAFDIPLMCLATWRVAARMRHPLRSSLALPGRATTRHTRSAPRWRLEVPASGCVQARLVS